MAKRTVRKAGILSGILFLLCLFVCFWWFGVFSDVGKTNRAYDIYAEDRYRTESDDPFGEATEAKLEKLRQKSFSNMTAGALVDTLAEWSKIADIGRGYDAPESLYDTYTDPAFQPYSTALIRELSTRKNAGKALLHAYQETSSNDYNKLAILEPLLARPALQKHLTPWKKARLQETADDKQRQKLAEAEYLYSSYNFLYTDTYNENGWIEEKVQERLKALK